MAKLGGAQIEVPVAVVSASSGAIAQKIRLSIAIMDPVTWFAPMWAFLCGAAASGHLGDWPVSLARTAAGMLMAGPVLLGLSQIINNYCDRDVDAINEPNRPIPSGRVTMVQVSVTALVLLAVGIALAFALGRTVAILVGIGLLLAASYSIHPLRFKRNGWLGNGTVSFAYEGLPWLAGTAALSHGDIGRVSIILALLYSIGAHGIMTVNDFKSVEGDIREGIRTLPVMLGERNAALYCCAIMNVAQICVVVLAITNGRPLAGMLILLLTIAQWPTQLIWMRQPKEKAQWYNGTGIMLYVVGMLVAAFGIAAPLVGR